MKYTSAASFRVALEDRLKRDAATGLSLARARKAVVFDRFLARLSQTGRVQWALKGGLALQLRLGGRARTTKDIDIDRASDPDEVVAALQAAARLELGDHFQFEVERAPIEGDDPGAGGAIRFRIRATLAGRLFDEVLLDVGFRDPIADEPDRLVGPPLLRFAGIEPAGIPVAPLEQHLAEKLHAYSRTYGDGKRSSRTKDLVDVVLIAGMKAFTRRDLRAAVARTFTVRNTHAIPDLLAPPPASWVAPYRKLAHETGIPPNLSAGFEVATRLLSPALTDGPDARWSPDRLVWEGAGA